MRNTLIRYGVAAALLLLTSSGCNDFDAAESPPVTAGNGGAGGGDAGGGGAAPTAGSLIWFGPHPDDEFYVAPLLGHYCVDLGWDCLMVVMTRGEGGACGLSAGCQPDLTTVRGAEMRASAQLLGAELDHWDLGDNGRFEPYAGDVEDVLTLWATRSGSIDALLERVSNVMVARAPDLVLAPDWRHGNYCHPTHRATGAVVAQAAADMEITPPLQLVASRGATVAEGLGFVPVVASDPTLESFDAAIMSDGLGAETWQFVVEVFRAHPSQFQFTAAEEQAFLNATRKSVYSVPLTAVKLDDPAYANLCPPSTF
jgi:LmbE family N-acetylglucosaminyl deacetylase